MGKGIKMVGIRESWWSQQTGQKLANGHLVLVLHGVTSAGTDTRAVVHQIGKFLSAMC